jgi:glycosyltransferase involved in cell wall biosynthesis
MLIEASAIVARRRPDARVLVVGGEPVQVEAAKAKATAAGASMVMVFTGQQPAKEIPGFVQAADLLVSPRMRGTNTPLKIYSYLRSGKPIVATNLLTHTQVLTPAIARLVDPGAQPLADAMLQLIEQPAERARLAAAAAAVAQEKYSRQSYLLRTAQAYARLGVPAAPAAAREDRGERRRDLAGAASSREGGPVAPAEDARR